jgi:rhodanese-related sulfurtransferase
LISPKEAVKLQRQGAKLVDVREAYEHNARRIEGSLSVPLSTLPPKLDDLQHPVIFYCQTGTRTVEASERLKAIAPPHSVQLAGGLDAWMEAGLPVTGGEKANLVGADLLKRLLNSINKANP